MLGLIEEEFTRSGNAQGRQRSPSFLRDAACELHAFRFELGDCRIQVVAHEIKLMRAVPRGRIGGMDGEFGGRKREDQPSVAGVREWQV